VREFNLNWDELVRLSRNSLRYSFAPEPVKTALLSDFDERLAAFGGVIADDPEAAFADEAVSYGFICRRYQLCDW